MGLESRLHWVFGPFRRRIHWFIAKCLYTSMIGGRLRFRWSTVPVPGVDVSKYVQAKREKVILGDYWWGEFGVAMN
jgi:hypothetical protein